mmetsp:Transcript_13943/g.26092  ORF Transcript_13943/g.26092 Transcript_13943/m.26092 type:complete len:208 (+) Transcript_13943:452-1075(+)
MFNRSPQCPLSTRSPNAPPPITAFSQALPAPSHWRSPRARRWPRPRWTVSWSTARSLRARLVLMSARAVPTWTLSFRSSWRTPGSETPRPASWTLRLRCRTARSKPFARAAGRCKPTVRSDERCVCSSAAETHPAPASTGCSWRSFHRRTRQPRTPRRRARRASSSPPAAEQRPRPAPPDPAPAAPPRVAQPPRPAPGNGCRCQSGQ